MVSGMRVSKSLEVLRSPAESRSLPALFLLRTARPSAGLLGLARDLMGRLVTTLKGLPCLALFALGWEILPRAATRFDLFDSTFIPPFSTVMRAFWGILLDGTLLKHATISLQRSGLGFALANVVAIPLGLMIGLFPPVERFCDPILQTFRQTAAMALFPVFIMLFGIGEPSKVILTYWGAQWPILLGTISGVKTMDPLLLKAARSMNVSLGQLLFKVVLPAAFPSIFTGVRLAATTSVLILIAAEMIGADHGLGYLVYDSQVRYEIPTMYAGILSLSLLGIFVDYSMLAIDRRNAWSRRGAK